MGNDVTEFVFDACTVPLHIAEIVNLVYNDVKNGTTLTIDQPSKKYVENTDGLTSKDEITIKNIVSELINIDEGI